jgi:2-polyprenyl-6-methoxyphenol hydroxylase-like FAD-dependent oxidoreductase
VIRKVLVVGGGIGGLTAGIALRQRGIEVDQVEIKPVMTVYGVGIIQPNNTLRALDKIGLAQACVDVGAPYPGWRIFDAAGNVLMDAPGTSEAAPNYPANNGITRPRLHTILTDAATSAGVAIRLGVTIDQFEDSPTGVDVRFTNRDVGRYDLVVGCDGLYSDLRKQLFPDAAQPRFTGQGVWRYNLPRPSDVEWGAIYNGPDSKVGLVPLSPTLMYMFIVSAEPGNPRFDGADMAAEMRRRLEAYTGPVERLKPLIVDAAEVVYRPLEMHMLSAPWMKGRVLLIGDAAHGTTPHLAQGAAMAIEDAVLLGELMSRDAPLAELLEEFMARRFSRTKFVVDSSVQIGDWEMEEWKGIHNPDSHPGELLHSATLALMAPY